MSSIPDPKDEAREPERSPTKSSGSLRIATVAGIPIRIHFTFLFLVAYVLAIGKGNLMALLLVLLVFACVILHELGHALTASRYGIKTRDITMYPIGGLALLQGYPSQPKKSGSR